MDRYGNTQPAGSTIKLAHAAVGTPLLASQGFDQNASSGTVQPAGIHSTAPYKGHDDKRCKYEIGPNRQCRGWRGKDMDYCPGHARKLGVIQHPQDVNKKAK